jgi:hypothetical protein
MGGSVRVEEERAASVAKLKAAAVFRGFAPVLEQWPGLPMRNAVEGPDRPQVPPHQVPLPDCPAGKCGQSTATLR